VQPSPPPGFRGDFRGDLEARAVYSESAGIARILPSAVAVPRDAGDVVTLVTWAHETSTPLVPRGSGSSMGGGAVGEGVVVDLSRLTSIGAPDVDEMRIWCAPGAVRGAIDRAARGVGLRLPVDPSSGAYCTIGGMVGTNAAGAHTLRFGATRSWVTALDCVFADGTRAVIVRGAPLPSGVPAIERVQRGVRPLLRRSAPPSIGVRKNSSGYALADYARSGELVDLLVGSEGTLCLFVGIELALAPVPGATASLLASFDSLEGAVLGAASSRESGASACELLDRTFLEVAAEGGSAVAPTDAEAVLLIEVEGRDADEAGASARTLASRLSSVGAGDVRLGLDAASERTLWELRHAASPILARLDPRLRSMQFIEDGAVPPDRLPEYVRGIRGALAARGVRGVIFGHAGDAHIHVNPLIDVSPPGWRETVAALLDDVVALTARLGGTLAGEHGDGRLRAPLLDRTWGAEATALFARVKLAFDPAGILNPGVKVPLPGQRPLGPIKYDPALAPMPVAARRALDRVASERAYARWRLELLEEGATPPG
jgi:FAD/FMN-containing dehydrogenase